MSIVEALQRYTLLTIGEGIVTQIPALLISTATGIIVTRAASEGSFGHDLSRQLVQEPRALLIAAGLLLLFGFFGLPPLFMFAMASLLVLLWLRGRSVAQEDGRSQRPRRGQPGAAASGQAAVKPAESVVPLLSYDPMELEIGFGLIPLVDVSQGGDLLERITMIRRHAARELGIVVPPIRVRDNLQLKPSTYVVKIYGLEVARAEVMVSRLLAMNPGTATERIDGIPTTEPAFGLPALWIAESARGDAEMAGYTVIDPTSVIATHLTEIIKTHAPDLLGRQETSALLDNVKQHYPVVVDELIPNLLTVGEVQRVLQNLLRERIPIRNLLLILENLADGARAIERRRLPDRARARSDGTPYLRRVRGERTALGHHRRSAARDAARRSGSPRRGRLRPARSERPSRRSMRRSPAGADGAAERPATDRPDFAEHAPRAQTAHRARRTVAGRALVQRDRARSARRVDRTDFDDR